MKRIAILASGSGSNAEQIARYFSNDTEICVDILLADREAKAVERMKPFGIEARIIERKTWREHPETIVQLLRERGIDLIVLAGFLSFVAPDIVHAFPHRIINLHPSLLPKFGGKGMWGDHVHRAVLAAREQESGITIHYVSEEVDEGQTIAQFRCPVMPDDTPETLATRIHQLEHEHLPAVIRQLLNEL